MWIAGSAPVSTAGAPAYVVPVAGTGGYSLDVPASGSTFFVAVAARRGGPLGPVSMVEVASRRMPTRTAPPVRPPASPTATGETRHPDPEPVDGPGERPFLTSPPVVT